MRSKKSAEERIKDLYNDLIATKLYLDKIGAELEKENSDVDVWENLYEKQFELAMKLSSVYGKICDIAESETTDDNKFTLRRIKQEADKQVSLLTIG